MKWIRDSRARVNVASLLVSLALNAALATWLAVATGRPTAPATAAPQAPLPELPSFRKPVHRIVQVTNLPPQVDFDWSLVESIDYREYIANLRAIHCPERSIRDIIFADLARHYRARADAVRGQTDPRRYWQSPATQAVTVEQLAQLKAIADEQRAVWRDLFGEDLQLERELAILSIQADEPELHLSFLPVGKRDPVARALLPFTEREAELRAGLRTDPAQLRRRLAELDAARRQALLAVLTPAEAEELLSRTSETARELRAELLAVQLTPAEFKAVVSARQRLQTEPARATDAAGLQAREEQLLATALGAERLAEFQRGTNLAYAAAWHIARQAGRPVSAAAEVYQIKRTAEAAAEAVRAKRDTTAGQRRNLLQSIRQEAEKSIRQALGDQGFDAYRREGGLWLTSLGR